MTSTIRSRKRPGVLFGAVAVTIGLVAAACGGDDGGGGDSADTTAAAETTAPTETTDVIERLCIEAALELTRDNRASAAEMLGLSRQSLYVKLRRYGLGDLDGHD